MESYSYRRGFVNFAKPLITYLIFVNSVNEYWMSYSSHILFYMNKIPAPTPPTPHSFSHFLQPSGNAYRIWNNGQSILGLFLDHFETTLGQFWDNYRDYFGTILGPFLFWPLVTYFDLWGPILTLNWVCLLLHLLVLKRGPKAPRRARRALGAQRAPQPSAGARRMGA